MRREQAEASFRAGYNLARKELLAEIEKRTGSDDPAVRWWQEGYWSAQQELTILLEKVDERHQLGVVRAWLLQ